MVRLKRILIVITLGTLIGSSLSGKGTVETLDDGNLLLYFMNDGTFGVDPNATRDSYSGLYYPKDSYKYLLSGGGIWIAGKKKGKWHATLSGGGSEFTAGPAFTIPDTLRPFPLYRITRGENHYLNDDFRNWPVTLGAQINSLGEPLISGSQTVFSLFADTYADAHDFSISGTPPLGVEVRLHAYTYDDVYQLLDTTFSQIVFLDYQVINVTSEAIDSCIVSIYLDPDIGYEGSDRVGCSSTLGAGFCYDEADYDQYYGSKLPVVGACLLENEVSSINFYHSRSPLDSLHETINLLKGLALNGTKHIDPTSGLETFFPYGGIPETDSGWINELSRDYRILLNTLPVTLASHDTTHVLVALIVAQGNNTMESLSRFLQEVDRVRDIYVADSTRPRVSVVSGENHSAIADTLFIQEPNGNSSSEMILRFENPTLFMQEVALTSSDYLKLIATPARFELGSRQATEVMLNVNSDRPEYLLNGVLSINCFTLHNSQREMTVEFVKDETTILGDINRNGEVDFSDLVGMVRALYRDEPLGVPWRILDADCDLHFDLKDIVIFLNVIFYSQPVPCDAR